LQPVSANNWNNLGVALYRNDQYEEAVDSLRKADEMIAGGDRVHRLFYAMALWQLSRQDEARAKYAQGAAWIEAVRANSKELQRFRDEAETLIGLDGNDREELVSDFFAGELSSKPTAQDWIDRASGQRKRDLRRESVASLTAALKLDPESSNAYNDRAWDYMMLGEHEKAIADLDEALRLDPDSTRALADRAWANNNLGRYPEAIADCDRAIELDPNHYFAFQRRAWAHHLTGKLDRAARDAKRAIEIDPVKTFGKDQLKQVANEFVKSEQWDKAIECFDSLVEVAPDNIVYQKNRANCELISQGLDAYQKRCREIIGRFATPESSIQDKRRAVTVCNDAKGAYEDTAAIVRLAREVVDANPPGAAWNKKALAIALFRDGQAEKALPLLIEVESVETDGFRGQTLFFLALANQAAGQTDAAKEWLKQAEDWTSEFIATGDVQGAMRRFELRRLQQEAHEVLEVPLPATAQTEGTETTNSTKTN
jgi:tetratricopeptide (TPR) repeat protein